MQKLDRMNSAVSTQLDLLQGVGTFGLGWVSKSGSV
ncbi:MAG: hypothetical protein ACI8V0_003029, partial [Pseudohongiellaceae bacterium]